MKRRSFITRASLLSVPFLGSRSAEASERSTDGSSGTALPPSDVRRYGATGDGITDDSASIQAAVNASIEVYFPAGNYLIRKKIDLRTGSSLIGDGAATLRTDGTSFILSAVGKIGRRQALQRDVKRGDVNISIPSAAASSYALAGGYFLQSDKSPLGHAIHKSGELGVVTSVRNNVLLVAGSTLADYLAKDNAMAAPVTFVENISIRGLHLSNDNYKSNPTTRTSALIALEFVKDFRISDCTLKHNNSSGISVFNSIGGVIGHNIIGQLADGPSGILGYGVQIGFSSQNITVSGNSFSECRHAVTTGTGTKASRTPNYGVSRGLAIVGNSVSNCSHAGLDTHEDSDGVTITGNAVTGCKPVGIHVRSYRSSISGNTITACRGKGIRLAKTARDTIVSGNIISGIRIASSDGDAGNRISNCDRHGISVQPNARNDISITGNSCLNNGQATTGDGININRRGNISRLTVIANTCANTESQRTQRSPFAVEPRTVLSQGDCLVSNNNFSASPQSGFQNRDVTIDSHSSTFSVAGATVIILSGSGRINNLDNGVVGQTVKLMARNKITITNSSRVRLNRAASYAMANGDTNKPVVS